MNDLLAAILKDTYTLSRLKSRLRAIKANLIKNFFGGTDEIAPAVAELNWLSRVPKTFYDQFNKDNVYQVFEGLEKQIEQLPTLVMYLTFEPDEVALSQIGSFARKNFGSNFLLDIKLDPALIAGCSLVWKGRLRDYSLRAKMDEKKGEILENFKKFLR